MRAAAAYTGSQLVSKGDHRFDAVIQNGAASTGYLSLVCSGWCSLLQPRLECPTDFLVIQSYGLRELHEGNAAQEVPRKHRCPPVLRVALINPCDSYKAQGARGDVDRG